MPWKVPLDFWRTFRQEVLKTHPDAYIAAEVWRGTVPWMNNDTVHGVMNYQVRNAILDYLAFDHMDAEDFDYELGLIRHEHGPSAPYHLNLLGSHDTPRILTLCGGDVARVRLAAIFQFTYIGIPIIYYGDEIGMAGENDPFCRAGMVWDESRWNGVLFDTYRTLATLRRSHPALTYGDFAPLLTFNGVYAYHRCHAEDNVIVVLNPREARRDLGIPLSASANLDGIWQDALSGVCFSVCDDELLLSDLPARAGLVLTPVKK